MPTLITVKRDFVVLSLLEIEHPEFADKYGLGMWWSMFSEHHATGPLQDRYVIENIIRNLYAGRYDALTSPWFMDIGFYVGMLHGGFCMQPSDTLVVLTDPDFTKGYHVGRDYHFTEAPLDGRIFSDRLFIEAINTLALEYREYHEAEEVIKYSLGCRIGELSGAAIPLAPAELTFEGTVNTGAAVRLVK